MADSDRRLVKFYARFGSDVVGAVKAKAKPDGDIKHLLRQLGLPMTGVVDRQHLILSKFVQQHGKSAFLKALSLSGGAVAVRQFLQDLERKSVIERRSRQSGGGEPDEEGESESVEPSRPDLTIKAKAQALATGKRWVETDSYVGPERRSGTDRRTGPKDRRQSCELIMFKNRRFGAPRRKKGRRSGDPK
jgi:hypothetical protein